MNWPKFVSIIYSINYSIKNNNLNRLENKLKRVKHSNISGIYNPISYWDGIIPLSVGWIGAISG